MVKLQLMAFGRLMESRGTFAYSNPHGVMGFNIALTHIFAGSIQLKRVGRDRFQYTSTHVTLR